MWEHLDFIYITLEDPHFHCNFSRLHGGVIQLSLAQPHRMAEISKLLDHRPGQTKAPTTFSHPPPSTPSSLPPSVQTYFQFWVFFPLSLLSSDPGSHLPESSFVGWSAVVDRVEENTQGRRCEQKRFQNHPIPSLVYNLKTNKQKKTRMCQ